MARKLILTLAIAAAVCSVASAQSTPFNLARWVEIQNALLKELNRSYVDSLPVDRMELAGIDAMLDNLDPYTVYIPEEETEDLEMMLSRTYGGLGAVIFKPEKDGPLFITEPYKGSPAELHGIRCGDEVLSIDGTDVHGLTSAECSSRMRGKPGTELVLKVKRVYTGVEEELHIIRQKIQLPVVEYSGMITPKVGYICQTGFTEGVSDQIRKAVVDLKAAGMDTLVLDLRSNGGGILQEAVKIVSLFVPRGSLVVSVRGPRESQDYRTVTAPLDTKLPIIVLIDAYSASASEIVAGALQDMDRATIMGQRSYGKGLVQSLRPMPYRGQLKLTTAKYYTPSGRCVQAIDYSNRREDGSVDYVPDSLTHEFRTARGRIVKDGGGITPDVKIDEAEYSRPTRAVVLSGVVEEYAFRYVCEHEAIAPAAEFRFEDYDDFVAFAAGKDFDYRSEALTYFDRMVSELDKDGLHDTMAEQVAALRSALDMGKEEFLRLKKDEIIPFIEEAIVVRYYFQPAKYEVRIRYDSQLRTALGSPLI